MPVPIDSLAFPMTVAMLAPRHAALTEALRIWGLMGRMGWCPARLLTDRLGTMRAAAHFQLLMEKIGAAWPEPFCISPPCSPRLSHDEATLAQMVQLAGDGDLPGFDRLLADLIPADERERLYVSARSLNGSLAGVRR
jgi:hypothetical protein